MWSYNYNFTFKISMWSYNCNFISCLKMSIEITSMVIDILWTYNCNSTLCFNYSRKHFKGKLCSWNNAVLGWERHVPKLCHYLDVFYDLVGTNLWHVGEPFLPDKRMFGDSSWIRVLWCFFLSNWSRWSFARRSKIIDLCRFLTLRKDRQRSSVHIFQKDLDIPLLPISADREKNFFLFEIFQPV